MECAVSDRQTCFGGLHSRRVSPARVLTAHMDHRIVGAFVSCPLCASGNQAESRGEMIPHFCGLKNLDKSGVLLFPNLQVCLDCGFSRFRTTETELALLAGGTSTSERLTMVAS